MSVPAPLIVKPAPVIDLANVSKSFGTNRVLTNVSLAIHPGESVAIVGRSGSGKSTLLNIMAVLTGKTSGTYRFLGSVVNSSATTDAASIGVRRRTGYISQGSDFVPNLSVYENLLLAARCHGLAVGQNRRLRLDVLLHQFGLSSLAEKRPNLLSGGQKQRANIVRALFCEPVALFADEPTGALDPYNGGLVIDELIDNSAKKAGIALVLVTHNPEFAARCDRQILLFDEETRTHLGRPDSICVNLPGINSKKIRKFITTLKK